MPMTARPLRSTSAGDWFLPADGGSGSLLRVAGGVPADAVRRGRDLGLPGLLPIGNVVAENGQVWLRTPQPPGPSLDELLDAPLTCADAAVVLRVVVGLLLGLHAMGLTHGSLDGAAILLDPDGAPLVVAVEAVPGERAQDAADVAGLAWALAEVWGTGNPEGAALLRRCADLAETTGLDAVLAALPRHGAGTAVARRSAARGWSDRLAAVPAPRSGAEDRSPSVATP
jgi:hypothetical protein